MAAYPRAYSLFSCRYRCAGLTSGLQAFLELFLSGRLCMLSLRVLRMFTFCASKICVCFHISQIYIFEYSMQLSDKFLALMLTLQILLSLLTTYPKVGLLTPCGETPNLVFIYLQEAFYFFLSSRTNLWNVF